MGRQGAQVRRLHDARLQVSSSKVTFGDGAALPERDKCVASWGFMNNENNTRRDQWCTNPK
eukprot:5407872-Prymnesium_polylepis.1